MAAIKYKKGNDVKGINDVPNVFGDFNFPVDIDYKDGAKNEKEILRQNNRNSKTYNDFLNLLNYNTTLEDRARQFETDYQVTAIMREQQRQQYINSMKARDIQMNAQLKAYGKSADQTAQQLKFNKDAAERGIAQAEQIYQDRLKGIDFSARGQQIQRDEQLANLTEQFVSSQDQLSAAQTAFSTAYKANQAQYTEATRYSEALKTLADDRADRDYNTTEDIADAQKIEAILGVGNQQTEALRAINQQNLNAYNALTAQTGEANRAAQAQGLELIRAAGISAQELVDAASFRESELLAGATFQKNELATAAGAQADQLTNAAAFQSGELRTAAEAQANQLTNAAAFQSGELKTSATAQAKLINDSAAFQAGELTTSATEEASELITSTANQRALANQQARDKFTEGLRAAGEQFALAETGSILDYESRKAEIDNAIDNQKVNMQQQVHRQQIDQLISSGSAAAKGGRGTTGKRALQTLGVLSSTNQAQMISSFIRFQGQQAGALGRLERGRQLSKKRAEEVRTAITNELTNMYALVGAQSEEATRAAQARATELLRSSQAKSTNITDTATARTTELLRSSTAQADEATRVAEERSTELTRSAGARADEATRAAGERADELKRSAKAQGEESERAAKAQGAEAVRSADVLSAEQKKAAANRAFELEASTRNAGNNAVTALEDRNAEQLKSTTNQFNERVRSETQRANDAYAAAIAQAGDRRTSIKADAAESKTAADNRALNAYNIAGQQAVDQLGMTEDRIATEQIALAERVGIINMRTELSLEELGESMLSAMDAFNDDQQGVFMEQFQADSRAIASMMAKPEFADAPDAPFVIPDPEFIPPVVPPEAPKVMLPPSPPQQSGLSKALQITGAIISVAAAPFTGGSSLAAGIAAGGAGLSTIGSFV